LFTIRVKKRFLGRMPSPPPLIKRISKKKIKKPTIISRKRKRIEDDQFNITRVPNPKRRRLDSTPDPSPIMTISLCDFVRKPAIVQSEISLLINLEQCLLEMRFMLHGAGVFITTEKSNHLDEQEELNDEYQSMDEEPKNTSQSHPHKRPMNDN
jgi:hypothetical protein